MDKKTIEKIMHLARIELTDDEKQEIPSQMEKIINYIDNLNTLDTSGVLKGEAVFLKEMMLQPDRVETFPDIGLLTENAPSFSEGFFKVKKVL